MSIFSTCSKCIENFYSKEVNLIYYLIALSMDGFKTIQLKIQILIDFYYLKKEALFLL